MTHAERIAEIRKRVAEATPSPWKADFQDNAAENWLIGSIVTGMSPTGAIHGVIVTTDQLRASEVTSGDAEADAALIVCLRNNIDYLIAIVTLADALADAVEGAEPQCACVEECDTQCGACDMNDALAAYRKETVDE